jgi:hypothetical protein
VLVHTYDPSTWEAEAGGSLVQGQLSPKQKQNILHFISYSESEKTKQEMFKMWPCNIYVYKYICIYKYIYIYLFFMYFQYLTVDVRKWYNFYLLFV